MAGVAIITEACIAVKDRACVDVCPVQCIYEFDSANNVLVSEQLAGSGVIENQHAPSSEAISIACLPLMPWPTSSRSLCPETMCASRRRATAESSMVRTLMRFAARGEGSVTPTFRRTA